MTVWQRPFSFFLFFYCAVFSLAQHRMVQAGQPVASDKLPWIDALGKRNELTGTWNGERKHLKDQGIDINARYVGESATVYAGGTGHGSDYADDLGLYLDFDLGKIAGWQGAIFHFAYDRRHGGSASANDLGNNILTVQEGYGVGETNRLAELSLEQQLLHQRIDIKIGDYVMGNDFARTSVLCDFENLGFCAHAESMPNDAAWADWPTAQLGARLRVNLRQNLYAEVGAYEANSLNKKAWNGFNLSLDGATGAIFPLEFGLKTHSGRKKLAGTYKLGGYYDTSEAADQNKSGKKVAGRYGGWLLGSQRVVSFASGTQRGVNLYLQGTLSDKPTAPMSSYLLGAVIVQGPLRQRPDDYANLGCVHAGVNPRALRAESAQALANKAVETSFANAEIDCEAGYGWQLTRAILFHPNFQYVRNPAAFNFGHLANGWVFGTMTKIVF